MRFLSTRTRSVTLLPLALGKPLKLKVADEHVKLTEYVGSGSSGTFATTVLDVCVIGAPWPAGGVPVSVALFSTEPAALSAAVTRWLHLKIVFTPGPIELFPGTSVPES